MPEKQRYAPVYPHDDIREIYPDVFLLHGSIRMGPGMRVNRSMLILRQRGELTLINPVRMNEAGLAALDELGVVSNVIRLGDFHGLDDGFYLDRYRNQGKECRFWCQPGQETYALPEADIVIDQQCAAPLEQAEFFIFQQARYPEAALLLKQHKLLITTDALQYYQGWSYTSWLTRLGFKALGFKPGLNIGPPWLKRVTPEQGSVLDDFQRLVKLDFTALIAAHGQLLAVDARAQVQQVIEQVFATELKGHNLSNC